MSFRCRACGGGDLQAVVSLGETPLANALLTEADLARPEPRYPLNLLRCRRCTLVQISETVSPEQLFREYAYFSSFSDTMLAHASALVDAIAAARSLGPSSLAVEVASNDGYLLQFYVARRIPVLGIEPAENVARVAREKGIETVAEFFGETTALRLARERRRADVLHAHNVLAHVPDPVGFARGVAHLLAPAGLAIVEVPYLRDLLERCEFDTIYHEHLSYFSLTALTALFESAGLRAPDVECLSIHGGSLRLYVEHDHGQARAARLEQLLAEERAWGVHADAAYERFSASVATLRAELSDLLWNLKRQGARIAAYGAAAKGSTLLNVCGVDGRLLDFVADRSPYKQGRFMPGVRLPIVSPDRLLQERPDYLLLLTWNFADEIMQQQAEYRRRGGRFILPVPRVGIVEPN